MSPMTELSPYLPTRAFFLTSDLSARSRAAQPSLTTWRPRPSASASAGTSAVITEPVPKQARPLVVDLAAH